LVGGAVLAAGAVAFVVLSLAANRGAPPSTSAPARAPADDEERRKELREAFGGEKAPAPGDAAQELAPLFEGLGRAYRARDGEAVLAHFDLERLADEIASLGTVRLMNADQKRAFVRGARQGLSRSVQEQAVQIKWTSTEIKNVKSLNEDEAVVIARHQDGDGAPLKMRWWVTRGAGSWKVYDLEFLDVGIRLSTTAASFAGRDAGAVSEVGQAAKTLGEAMLAARQNDLDTAERKLKQVEQVPLPGQLEGVRLMAVGVVQLRRGRPQEALDALGRRKRSRRTCRSWTCWRGRPSTGWAGGTRP
jgi:hypothetical protein